MVEAVGIYFVDSSGHNITNRLDLSVDIASPQPGDLGVTSSDYIQTLNCPVGPDLNTIS